MIGLKGFIEDFKIKKKAYNLLTLIIEKYEFERGLEEIVEIH
jgi:hypothetical protein